MSKWQFNGRLLYDEFVYFNVYLVMFIAFVSSCHLVHFDSRVEVFLPSPTAPGGHSEIHRNNGCNWLSRRMTKATKWHVRPTKTQISLGIHPVWSESSLCALWVAKDLWFLHSDSEDSDQIGQMPRLIWVFARRTGHFVGFVMLWLWLTLFRLVDSAVLINWTNPFVILGMFWLFFHSTNSVDPDQPLTWVYTVCLSLIYGT